ncbi:MAG: CDP-diacylglycerol-inositol 3-phosphatidyltransferase [Stictis urceolatum]|nr:CDP-diacylglycerol-inositol 3-phosphatidyltransferase [Stictis urceolata]
MSSMRTRKQARDSLASEAASQSPSPSPRLSPQNGSVNGSARSPRRKASPAARENIFLFWPNLIGYSRIILAIASLYYMPLHPRTCSILYSVSCILDALDGVAARHFEQATRFGAVLDMVTDRCTTACLLVFLSSAWPRWSLLFQGLISLDLASHYMHMYATLVMGGQGDSHKKNVLFAFCALNELFFIALYLLSFSSPTLSPSLLQPPSSAPQSAQPGSPAHPKLSNLFPNPYSAGALELARANKMDSFWPWVIAGISFPVMAGKQFINVVQLVKASRWLAEGDMEARRAQGLPRKRK